MQQDGSQNTIASSKSSHLTTKDTSPWWYLPFFFFTKPTTTLAPSLASSQSSVNKESTIPRGSTFSTPPSSRTSIVTTPSICQASVSESITTPPSPESEIQNQQPVNSPKPTHSLELSDPSNLPETPPPLSPASSLPTLKRKYNHLRRKRPRMERDSGVSALLIPPYSPTYCKPNEFPYSNFYLKLPNGRWMIRYRSGTRLIIGTDVLDGYMI